LAIIKILHVIPSVGPFAADPASLTRSLSRHGMEVHVATTDDNGPLTLDVPHGIAVNQDLGTQKPEPKAPQPRSLDEKP
jgi:hypothetical protein